MKVRLDARSAAGIATVAILGAAHALAVGLSLRAPAAMRLTHDVAGWAGSWLGVGGTIWAMISFARGDDLRRVWAFFSAAAALLLLGTALRSYWVYVAPERPFTESPLLPYRMVVVVAANALATIALVTLLLAYRRSGLIPPLTLRAGLLWLAAAAAALAIGVPQLATDTATLGKGVVEAEAAVTSIASTLGDMASIFLIAPILWVAYVLRGGRLAWVWWAMALGGAAWLLYDSRLWIAALLPGSSEVNLEFIKVTRSLGLASVGLAGWLQASLRPLAPASPGV